MKSDVKALLKILGLSFALVVLVGFVVGVPAALGWLNQEAAKYLIAGCLVAGVLVICWLAPIPLTPVEEKPANDMNGDMRSVGENVGQQETSETIPMVRKPVGVKELLASGSWYAIPAIWGLFAVVMMAIRLSHLLLLAAGVGLVVYIFLVIVYAAVYEQRSGKRPHPERLQRFSARLTGPIFSVIWSGFAAGCVVAVFVVIHVNDPFTKEAVDRVVDSNAWLFWSAVAAGALVGAGGRIWSLAKPGQLPVSDQDGDPGTGTK